MLQCFLLLLIVSTSTLLTSATPRSSKALAAEKISVQNEDNNPFKFPCSSNADCLYGQQQCVTYSGPNSTYWWCNCYCGEQGCGRDEDCCTGICNNGVCAAGGGTQGDYCGTDCPTTPALCAPGYVCQPWGNPYQGMTIGYCDYNSSTTVQPVTTTTATQPYNACSNHGNYTCNCFQGYAGQNCEHEIDFCNELITDFKGAPVRASDLCLHGTCTSSPEGAICNCDQGFTGKFCQNEIENETAITTRCALYATNSTQQMNVPTACPVQQICIPDHESCAMYGSCDKPLGWCIPITSTSNRQQFK